MISLSREREERLIHIESFFSLGDPLLKLNYLCGNQNILRSNAMKTAQRTARDPLYDWTYYLPSKDTENPLSVGGNTTRERKLSATSSSQQNHSLALRTAKGKTTKSLGVALEKTQRQHRRVV